MLNRTLGQKQLAQLLFLLLLQSQPLRSWASFGNEYVHIKVHVPKEHLPKIADTEPPSSPHNVIHHFHHHPRVRNRPPPPSKPKSSPVLESVILSELDKPLHASEHADYLNHAKELAEHLSETYVVKKLPPTPPHKKKVNTYTVIEEQHAAPHGYDFDELNESAPENVETYRVIDTRPQHHYHSQPHHQHSHHHFKPLHSSYAGSAETSGYHYHPSSSSRYQHARPSSYYSSYVEPAPVEEHVEQEHDHDNDYQQPSLGYIPSYARSKSSRAAATPLHTLVAPEQSAVGQYGSSSAASSHGFRPSPQLPAADIPPTSYDGDADEFAAPVPITRHRRPEVNWSTDTGYNSPAADSYQGVDSYNAGHVQGVGSGDYQYAGPYAP